MVLNSPAFTLQDLQKEKDELNKEKVDAESALEEAQRITRCKNEELLGQATRLLEMEHEIEALKHELETRKETEEDPQQLALDLEREKGRLAGQWTLLIRFRLQSSNYNHFII